MKCEVCLSEELPQENIVRVFDTEENHIREAIGDIPHSLNRTLAGFELRFHREEDVKEATHRLGAAVYSEDGKSMEVVVGELLKAKGLTLSVAESCTGGLLSARLVNVPGSSEYFVGGVVVYSNRLKEELLGVRKETLERHGAVSEETCKEMLAGLKSEFKTDAGIAITGIAGPGGSGNKPEGLTYIGVYLGDRVVIDRRVFGSGRNPNRFLSSQVALNNLRKLLIEEEI